MKKLLIKTIDAISLIGKKTFKFLLSERTILFVTNQKIRSFKVGPLPQFIALCCMIWVGTLFVQSVKYDAIITSKKEEIRQLKSINSFFEQEFDLVSEKLRKVNEYLIINDTQKQKVSSRKTDDRKLDLPKNIDSSKLSTTNQSTLKYIKSARRKLENINYYTSNRIKEIESALEITGLNSRKLIARHKDQEKLANLEHVKNNPSGGPIDEDCLLDDVINAATSTHNFKYEIEKDKFSSKVDKLIFLEEMINRIPLSRPMTNYYISSQYGDRIDPITKARAMHRGLDFVGPHKEEIISPSPGKVILAGRYSEYGKAIVIDHGYGITTRYGHLSKIKVKKGDIVKKGDVIGLQGNTGRSTGAHLHYEIRYKNLPLNPAKFIKAGDKILKDRKDGALYFES